MGGTHFWLENATGRLRLKSTAPASDADGSWVATIDGTGLLSGPIGTIGTSTTNGQLTVLGNKNAADSGADVVIDTNATRSAGTVFNVRNHGSDQFTVDGAGVARAGNFKALGTAPVYIIGTSASQGIITDTPALNAGANALIVRNGGTDKAYITANGYPQFSGHRMEWAAAAPGSGTWTQSDVVWNTGAAAGGSPGWVCTTGGTPGTWKAMANVAP
jgi:hypothetical protein